MKLIIDLPEEVYEALKSIAEDATSVDPYSLADIIVNKSKPLDGLRPQGEWIPITYRSLTEEEEKELCAEWGIEELEEWEKRVFTCSLPDDGQEILVSYYGKYVQEDTCSWDEYGCGLENNGDWDSIDAWMPKPEPYKKGGAE